MGTILCSQQQCMRVSVSLYPCQHLVWSMFLILAILICIFLMTSDAEHLLMCISALCISSSWCICSDLLHVLKKLGCLVSRYWILRVLYILDTSSLTDICFTLFTPSLWLYSLNSVLWRADILNFDAVWFTNMFFCGSCF